MLTYGFFNSSGGDRKYNADQMSAIFNGIINDGIFMSEGNNFVVVESANMIVNVGTGRAWFNGKWVLNNSAYAIIIDAAEAILNRIDVVVLEVDESDAVRACSIKVVKGTPGASPAVPTLTNTAEIHQYPLAQVYIGAAVTAIVQANITNKVGSVDTPYITGILETVDTTALLAQWDDEFTTWFASVQNILDSSTAGNLLSISTDLYLTTNVGNAYSITTGLSLTSLPGGYPICVEFNADATGAISINVDGLGAFPGLKASGDPVTNVKAGGIYTFRSDGTGNFILQGEGASGDAVAADLLSGKTATTDAGEITGTMPNIGQENITPSTTTQFISEGYHDGTGVVDSLGGDAIASEVLAGSTFSSDVAGRAVAGTMVDRAGDTAALSSAVSGNTLRLRASDGYRDGTNDYVTLLDNDWVEANIKSGVNIFGKTGNYTQQSAGGSVSTSSSTLYAIYNSGTGANWPYVEVSGLTFTPRTIRFDLANRSSDFFNDVGSEYFDYSWGSALGSKIVIGNSPANNAMRGHFQLNGTAQYVNSTGFRLPNKNASFSGYWRAFS